MANTSTTPDHRDAITLLARAGYGARGIVYLLVGGLAALAALGEGGQTTGSRGALQEVLTAPLGGIMLGAIAVGLAGFALWRFVQAVMDTDQHGADAKGVAIRSSLLISAVTHGLLAFFAVDLIFTLSAGSGGSGGGSGGFAAWLMSQPYGRWLVAAVGVALVAAGIAHEIKAWKTKFDRHFSMPPQTQNWAYPLCRFGLAIRGLVFLIAGGFFILAGYQINPEQAGGLAEVFSMVRSQIFGRWLLGLVAVGLFAFGLYSLLEAIYRRLNPPA